MCPHDRNTTAATSRPCFIRCCTIEPCSSTRLGIPTRLPGCVWIAILIYFAVWMFIHRLGWWFWWFWMLPGCRFQTSWDHLVPPTAVFFDASKRTSAPDSLPWLVGGFSGISGYPPLHPTVSAAVADLSSGSTCGATRAFAAGFEGLGSWRTDCRSCGYEMVRGKTNPTRVWKHHETSPNRPLVDTCCIFPKHTVLFPTALTVMFQSLWEWRSSFFAEQKRNRTAPLEPWILGTCCWVAKAGFIIIYIYMI